MALNGIMTQAGKKSLRAFCKDVLALMKPRIIVLLVITCLGGTLVATNGNTALLDPLNIALACLGLALSAGGANMVNMWYDRDIDAVMNRTKNRPIPAGHIHHNTALAMGVFLGIFSTAFLWLLVNEMTALMALAGYLFYTIIYTIILKRRTVQNIVIGGAAGAFPPVVGWAAVQNSVADFTPWLMFLIIFLWTPPHFWALALKKNTDYTNAGVPMLPVIKGVAETKSQIVYYMLLLLPVTLGATALTPAFGWIYFIAAAALGGVWLYKCVRLMRDDGIERAMDVFKFSLSYLALLFAAMVLDTFV